jgi:hypothetical protein
LVASATRFFGGQDCVRAGPPEHGDRGQTEDVMGDSGVGMHLGHWSVGMFYIWGIAIIVLGLVLLYGVRKSGHLRRSERAQLDRNTVKAQVRDDPQKQ